MISLHAVRRRRPSLLAAIVAVLVGGAVLAGCSATTAPAPNSPSAPAVVPAPTPSGTPEAPAFHPEGTAEENLAFFSTVIAQVWATGEPASSRAYVDALTAAGFPRDAMQVTPDTTTVGNPVESLQVSVRWGENSCLVGQVGPSTGEPVATVMRQLAEGRCLVGATLPIDW